MLADRLIDENGGDETQALQQITGVNTKLKNTSLIDLIEADQIDVENGNPETYQYIVTAINNLIGFMKQRSNAIGKKYPFTRKAKDIISLKELTSSHKVYIILLISSMIRIITTAGGFAYRVTHGFEELCREPFKLLIPVEAEIISFASGGYSKERSVPENQSFYNKIKNLANRLSLNTTKMFDEETILRTNNGDGGLDWVGYLPFPDTLSSIPTFFAQCACGNDWEDKQFDAAKEKWRNYIHFVNDYKLYHFIPKSFRNYENKWANELLIYNVVLIDRFRLLHLIYKAKAEDAIIKNYTDLLTEIAGTELDF